MDVQPHGERAVKIVAQRDGMQLVNWLHWVGGPTTAAILVLLRSQHGRLLDELEELPVPE